MDRTNDELKLVEGGSVFFRSAPTQNDLRPAPVSTITRTSSSSRASASAARKSLRLSRSSALSASGRSRLTVATWSDTL